MGIKRKFFYLPAKKMKKLWISFLINQQFFSISYEKIFVLFLSEGEGKPRKQICC